MPYTTCKTLNDTMNHTINKTINDDIYHTLSEQWTNEQTLYEWCMNDAQTLYVRFPNEGSIYFYVTRTVNILLTFYVTRTVNILLTLSRISWPLWNTRFTDDKHILEQKCILVYEVKHAREIKSFLYDIQFYEKLSSQKNLRKENQNELKNWHHLCCEMFHTYRLLEDIKIKINLDL